MKDIQIALISSNEFAYYTSVAMVSVLKNIAKNSSCHFHVVTNDMKDTVKKRFQKWARNSRCTIDFPCLDPNLIELFKDCYTLSRVPRTTYARIVLPTILPDLDKIIYMDSDMFVRGDLSELWDVDLGNHYFAMVDDANKLVLSNMLWKCPDPKYFNAGILVINAKLLRDDDYLSMLRRQLRKKSKTYKICDQDVINDTFRNRILPLSPTWNMYAPWYGGHPKYEPLESSSYAEAVRNPKVVHCLGNYRPWFPSVRHPFKWDFYKYARLSPFYRFFHVYRYSYDETDFFYMTIYDHPFLSKTKSSSLCSIKVLGCSLYKWKKEVNSLTIKIIGIPLRRISKSGNDQISEILGGLLKVTKNPASQTCHFLGLPVLKTRIQTNNDSLLRKLSEQQEVILNKLKWIEGRIPLVAAQFKQALSVARLHSKVFPQFRNINIGRNVVICGAGPTGKYYAPLGDAVHIGVNSAALNESIAFDYIFLQDYNTRKYIEDFADMPATKFYGIFHEIPLVRPIINDITIPQSVADRAGALRYYSGYPSEEVHYDIEIFPLADFDSVVFPALQFALYTNPKRIYLVGCDCVQTGHFQTTNKLDLSKSYLNIPKITRGYRAIKKFAEIYYPEVEFISVNPVGLVGLFSDVYTESYLQDHPQIMGVEILK